MAQYKPHPKQIKAHLAFLTGGYKRGILFMGRQSGKTYFATSHAWLSAVIQQGRYFVVFKTYKQAHEVVWRQYIPLIPKELIYKTNEQDLLIELNYIKGPVKLPDGTVIEVEHDETKPRSTIQLLGSDQADSHRGFKAHGIIFDEYADQDPNNWDTVYEPMFTTTSGWAIFMGTPRGYNHFWELIELRRSDPTWFFLQATWRDSPYVSKEHMKTARRDAEMKGSLASFLQEYELEFRSVQGAVYPSFSRKVNVVKYQDMPRPDEMTVYAGIDFGYHTTACLLVGVDKDQNWYVFDEVYGRQQILQDLIPIIKDKLAGLRLTLMVGDSAAKDAIETMVKQFPIVPVVKRADSVVHGIDLIRTKLKPRIQLVGPPKPTLFIAENCKNFIKEMESYKYPEDKPNRNPNEQPVKEDDHGCFVSGTIVNGKPIEQIGEYMGKKKVYEYQLGNQTVIVTPDHPILTDRGLVRIDTLRYTDTIWQKHLFTTTTNGQETLAPLTGAIKCITSALARQTQAIGRDTTDISGGKRTVKYLLALMFTTLMATPSIIRLLISAVLSLVNTKLATPLMRAVKKMAGNMSTTLLKRQPNGQKLKRGKSSEASKVKPTLNISPDTKLSATATYAKNAIPLKPLSVDGATQTVKPKRYAGVEPTYNLRTKSGMYRANGVVVSNCDALRYLVLHLKYGVQKDAKIPESSLLKKLNDYGM